MTSNKVLLDSTALWHNNRFYGYRWRHHLQVLTNGPLVYIATWKCASTFFYNNFQQAGWTEVDFKDINWAEQRVISHIMEPGHRRIKGLAEFIHMNQCQDLIAQHDILCNMLARVPCLDRHSQSYFDTYGNYCWIIDWIPLQDNHQYNIDIIEKFLHSHNCPVPHWDLSQQHTGTSDKKHTEQRLQQALDQSQPDPVLEQYLEKDRELYRQVVDSFRPNKIRWDDCSWFSRRLVAY